MRLSPLKTLHTVSSTGQRERGFSLVEVLITICIIGVIASLATIRMRQLVKQSKAKAQIAQIVSTIKAQRASMDLLVQKITGTNCSICKCLSNGYWGGDLSPGCKATMDSAFAALGFNGAIASPWGDGYYWIDENDGEDPSICRGDSVGVWDADRKIEIWTDIPPTTCSPQIDCYGYLCNFPRIMN